MMRLCLIVALLLQVSSWSFSGDHSKQISSPYQDWMLESQATEGAAPQIPRSQQVEFSPALIFAQYLIAFPSIEINTSRFLPLLPRTPFLFTQLPHSSQGPPLPKA